MKIVFARTQFEVIAMSWRIQVRGAGMEGSRSGSQPSSKVWRARNAKTLTIHDRERDP